ncbi:MAG TPA: thioredoxin family protein [Gracilimonas sp.]|nr:thioredoxin family protein [Gracilimonas sp.]
MNSARVTFFILLICFLLLVNQEGKAQDKRGYLIGEVTPAQIVENDRIFEVYVERYNPDPLSLDYLESVEEKYIVMVFFGSWCRESIKYIPGLVKTILELRNDQIEYSFIGVGEQKKMPDEFLNVFDIEYIPTVVVQKDGKELGRIVERPQLPIETELVQILKRRQEN